MIISLPEKFPIGTLKKQENNQAFIENGILKIGRDCKFSNIMYGLTYLMKGDRICYYCGKTISKKEMTLDHVYPRDFGGPSITDNLVPCCQECNNDKNNFTHQQYKEILLARQNGTAKQLKEEFYRQHEELRKKKMYSLPEHWIEEVKLSEIQILYLDSFNYKATKKYNDSKKFYNMYEMLRRPIVVDRKNNILDEFILYLFAKDKKLDKVPIIKLENVQIR